MTRIGQFYNRTGERLGSVNRLTWLLLSLTLALPAYLAHRTEPTTLTVFKQLAWLYLIDSVLFFFTDRLYAKIGTLTLIFLATLEVTVIIYYCLVIYAGMRV